MNMKSCLRNDGQIYPEDLAEAIYKPWPEPAQHIATSQEDVSAESEPVSEYEIEKLQLIANNLQRREDTLVNDYHNAHR